MPITMMQCVENLLEYACQKNLIDNADRMQTRNALYDLLCIEPAGSPPPPDNFDNDIEEILRPILHFYAQTPTQADLLDARIMGVLTPRQSEVIRRFCDAYQISPIDATDFFYAFCHDNHYIRSDRLALNQYWKTATEFGDLEITVNLSKPEKDPRDIAAAGALPQTNYPKCQLCLENVGFAGTLNHPARQNLRVIPVRLDYETWYFQYSPYGYYNEHCILLSPSHVPMKITESTFQKLWRFLEQFPHYFIGSNADLPIVGGSILTHDHFQGGRHVFPMEKAQSHTFYGHRDYAKLQISLVNWPLSVIRIAGTDTARLSSLCAHILSLWRSYWDGEADIRPFTGENMHNTITPIARRRNDGRNDGRQGDSHPWEMDLVLRNNRTSEQRPLGIFHPRNELHHIKKENIGLIEVMGLAVLPGRLDAEMSEMAKFLLGDAFESEMISAHMPWLNELLIKHGLIENELHAIEILRYEIGQVFRQVLLDAGVFKTDALGKERFHKFMTFAGFTRL